MTAKPITARRRLKQLTKPKGDANITVSRRALRILFDGLLAAEALRNDPLVSIAPTLAAEYGDKYAEEIKRLRGLQLDLDDALGALEVPA